MSTAMTLFGNTSKTALALLDGLEDTLTSTLAGGSGGGNRRISIEGGVFREIVGGKEVRVSEERAMNVVLVNAAPVSRMYFQGTYVKGQKTPPTCWSSDTQTPDPAVPQEQRQSKFCKDCKQHIKGSGQGDTRACRFQQRVALMLEGELDKQQVYQLTLPSTSVFGDAEGKKMPLQAYARYLKAHNTHAIAIVTEMRFDIDSATPKLIFKPVRPLNEEELKVVLEMREHPDTTKAITLNVSQMDGVIPAPARPQDELFEQPKPVAAKQAKKAEPAAEEEPVEEPKKVTKPAPPAPKAAASDDGLKSVMDDWDDE